MSIVLCAESVSAAWSGQIADVENSSIKWFDGVHELLEAAKQIAQSLAIDGSLGRADALWVVEVLRALAAARRHEQTS